MTRFNLLAVVLSLALLTATAGQSQEKKIVMTPVTYDGLKQEVLKNRGKVLVVDFWGSFCGPCIIHGFPHMAKMHEQYAKDGLAVVTVSVDADEAKIASANKILNSRGNPSLRHVHIVDPDITKRLNFKGVPCYYVFDRHGRWVRFGGDPDVGVDYDALEKTVVQMLKEK